MHKLLEEQLKSAAAGSRDGQVDWQRFVELVDRAYHDAETLSPNGEEELERHKQERELRASESRFRDFVGSASDWFWETDADYRLTFVSDWIGELLGLKPSAVLGLDYFDIGLDEDASLAERHRSDIATRQAFRDLTFHVGPQTGGKDSRYIRISGIPVFGPDGVFRGYRGIGADITRQMVAERHTVELRQEVAVRARTEEALRSSRERLKRLTDSLSEGIVVVTRDGTIKFANPAAKHLLDWNERAGDIEGHELDAAFLLKTERGAPLPFSEAPWQRVLQDRDSLRSDDATFLTTAGRSLSVAYTCAALSEEDGRISALISFRDIEDLKRAQREALQASRMASVGQLAAGIAHEINTPAQYVSDNLRFIGTALTKLLTLIEAARKMAAQAAGHPETTVLAADFEAAATAVKVAYLAKETAEALGESIEGVEQISRIVSSMKEFSLPGTTSKTMTDINRALDSTITVSRNEWKDVAEIERHFDPSLPAVLCHAAEINQAFLNLIINAAHAITASGKRLPGRVIVSTAQLPGFVEIRIADTGTGVPDAIKDRIFDPFFTTKEVGKGTGQGLAICRDIVVNKHGGAIDIAGKDGEGAVFIMRLPIGRERGTYA